MTYPVRDRVPPGYLPLRVPIEGALHRNGFAVTSTSPTADGLSLGELVRLSVHSNA